MRKLCIGLLIALIFTSCQKKDVQVNVVVKDRKMEGVEIFLSKLDTTITLDTDGKGSVVLPVKEAQYGSMKYKWKTIPVYFEPGKGFTTTFDMTPAGLEISFEGDGAAKNSFISGKEVSIPVMGDFGLQEDKFLAKMDKYQADSYQALDSKGFDKSFVEKEKKRIVYAINGILWQYARNQVCSDKFYDRMKSLIVQDEWLLDLSSYMNYIQGAVGVLANRGNEEVEVSAKDRTMNQLNYTLQNIENQKIKEFLVGIYAMSYVDSEGVSEAESIKQIFDQNVKDQEVIDAFYKIYNEGTTITKGKKAVGFKYQDINGKEVSLSDLKGKLVYIDIWATWCGPCREELPHLQKLEQAFKGTNVCFVSISTDKDKAKWEQTVKGEKLGGVQLHFGGDETFMDAFRVKGIPHFILIDVEGKIMEAKMTRPSDPKTAEYLSMYAELIE